MNNPKDISQELMLKYLSETANNEEAAEVEKWMANFEENKQYILQLKSLWANAESFSLLDQVDVEENWRHVQEKLSKQKAGKSRLFYRIAAALVFFISAAFLLKSVLYTPIDDIKLYAQELTEVSLPDGTLVSLKAGSTITYPEEFGDSRTVTFEGEAYFDVVSDSERPFIIEADDTETTVLGTAFNLRTATSYSTFELVLVEGKVSFSTADEKVVLTPGQRVALSPNGLLVKEDNKNLNFQAWQTGNLVFDNTRMDQVLEDIGNAYNVRFDLKNSAFADCTLTARYESEELEDILNTLEILFNTKFDQQQETILVNGGSCN